MLKQVAAIVIILIMLAGIAIADDDNKKLTILHASESTVTPNPDEEINVNVGLNNVVEGSGENSTGANGNVSSPGTQTPTISLFDAALRSDNISGNQTSTADIQPKTE